MLTADFACRQADPPAREGALPELSVTAVTDPQPSIDYDSRGARKSGESCRTGNLLQRRAILSGSSGDVSRATCNPPETGSRSCCSAWPGASGRSRRRAPPQRNPRRTQDGRTRRCASCNAAYANSKRRNSPRAAGRASSATPPLLMSPNGCWPAPAGVYGNQLPSPGKETAASAEARESRIRPGRCVHSGRDVFRARIGWCHPSHHAQARAKSAPSALASRIASAMRRA